MMGLSKWIVFMLVVGTARNAENSPIEFNDDQGGECRGALGMEDGTITDGQISASSEWNFGHGAHRSRLNIKRDGWEQGSWSSRRNDANQWLQIDLFDENARVTGIATQGRNEYDQWVSKYRLQYSKDGVNFQYYQEQGQTANKEFTGNKDRNTVVRYELNPPIIARYIRFRPVAWFRHISMRAELYGCLGTCLEPLGMQSGKISDEQLSASSEWDKNHGAYRARANVRKNGSLRGAWSSRRNDAKQWLQIDLGSPMTKILGIGTQGRDDFNQWVKQYKLQFSNDGVNFQTYKEQGQTVDKVFTGNKNRYTIVYHKLDKPLFARFIRFVPVAWNGHISMRVELYGCPALLKNLDQNGDGFATKSEVEKFGLVWKDVALYDVDNDGKINLEETKILVSMHAEVKDYLCHFKSTDTNSDTLVTVEELRKRFAHLKYDISRQGVIDFIKQEDVDVADNKLNYFEFIRAMFNA